MSGDLGGLLDPQSSGFDDSDEFDAAALLSQPLFNDSQGDLNVPNDLLPDQGDEMMTTESSTSNQQNHALLMQQQRERLQAFQMQQQQQHGGFQQHNQQLPQDYSDPSQQQHQQQQQMQNQNQFGGGFNQADSQMGNASFNMSDVQVQQNFQQLQQFQNQQQMNNSQGMMQQQMNNSQSMMQQQMNNSQHNMMQQMNNSQHNMMQQDGQSMMQQQNQQGFQNMQGGGMNSTMHSSRMNNSGAEFSRAPPGRSVSMPIQRMYGSSSVGKSNELLMMQQQQQLQAMQNGMFQQQQQQQQRDMDTSQQSHTSMQIASNMGGRGGMGQQQNMEGSLSSLGPPMIPQRNNSLPHPPESGMQGQSPIVQSPKMIPNNLQGAMFSPQKGSDGSEPPATVNEAMEKLCESMRRSAMSRSLVKQLSGRSAPQRGNLTATNSARMRQLMGGNTGRSVARANSGRSVQRSHSGRAGLGMDNAPNMPVRRIAHDSKHRMGARPEPSSRGVFRHQSAAAVMLQRRNPFPNNPQEFNPNGSGSSGGSGEG